MGRRYDMRGDVAATDTQCVAHMRTEDNKKTRRSEIFESAKPLGESEQRRQLN